MTPETTEPTDFDWTDPADFQTMVCDDVTAMLNALRVGVRHAERSDTNTHRLMPRVECTDAGCNLVSTVVRYALAPYRFENSVGFEPGTVGVDTTVSDEANRVLTTTVTGTHEWTGDDVTVDIDIQV